MFHIRFKKRKKNLRLQIMPLHLGLFSHFHHHYCHYEMYLQRNTTHRSDSSDKN